MKRTKPFKSNLGDLIKRRMPPGVESRVYRVQAAEPVLDLWEKMTPKERGEVLHEALGGKRTLARP